MIPMSTEIIDALAEGRATPEQQAKAAEFMKCAIEFMGISLKAFSEMLAAARAETASLHTRIATAEQESERHKAKRFAEERAVVEMINGILHPTRSS